MYMGSPMVGKLRSRFMSDGADYERRAIGCGSLGRIGLLMGSRRAGWLRLKSRRIASMSASETAPGRLSSGVFKVPKTVVYSRAAASAFSRVFQAVRTSQREWVDPVYRY